MAGHDVRIRLIKPNGFMVNAPKINQTGYAKNNDPPDQTLGVPGIPFYVHFGLFGMMKHLDEKTTSISYKIT
jgi:hypothetical protein